MRLAVFGSANLDYLVSTPAPPADGLSQIASAMVRRPGGQGMNQAIAAARLHDDVSFTGCVGDVMFRQTHWATRKMKVD